MKFSGIWIPADVMQCSALSDKAKIAYGLIASLDNEDGCYASNGFFGKVLGIESRQVRYVIEELVSAGLVIRVLDESGRTLRTIEKAAVELALDESKESARGNELPQGEAKNCRGGRQKIATNSKEDNKGDRDTKRLDPLPFSSPEFISAWNKWVDYRRDLKKPLHWKTINSIFGDFRRWGEQESIGAIETSINKGWLSLFAAPSTSKPLTQNDHKQPW